MADTEKVSAGACCKTFLKFFCGAFFTKKATEVKGEKPLSPSADGEIPFCLQKTQEWVNSQPIKG